MCRTFPPNFSQISLYDHLYILARLLSLHFVCVIFMIACLFYCFTLIHSRTFDWTNVLLLVKPFCFLFSLYLIVFVGLFECLKCLVNQWSVTVTLVCPVLLNKVLKIKIDPIEVVFLDSLEIFLDPFTPICRIGQVCFWEVGFKIYINIIPVVQYLYTKNVINLNTCMAMYRLLRLSTIQSKISQIILNFKVLILIVCALYSIWLEERLYFLYIAKIEDYQLKPPLLHAYVRNTSVPGLYSPPWRQWSPSTNHNGSICLYYSPTKIWRSKIVQVYKLYM